MEKKTHAVNEYVTNEAKEVSQERADLLDAEPYSGREKGTYCVR
jgi:hypothetical protein